MTLVLLTPIGLDAGCWEWMALPQESVAEHTFPGFGGRARAASAPTMATLADEVAATYDPPLDLVGVSLGGMVAQHLTLRHPARVSSLMVCCTGANADPETMEGRAQAAEQGGMEGVLQETLERWFTPGFRERDPREPAVAYARRTLLALDPGAFADGWRAIGGHDARAGLPEIEVPTTALAGSADAASAAARTREIAERVPGARFVLLDGPHMMQLEQPLALSAAIAEHLSWARGGLSVARLPEHGLEAQDPMIAEVWETFAQEGRDPIALYRVLAHSPLMLRAYAGLARGLRYEAQTPRELRELMILRTAQLTGSDYEWAHHRAMAAANGVPAEQVVALEQWRTSECFDERERAALRCVEEMHDIALSDEAFAALERIFGGEATVELVLLSAFYEAVARMIQAFGLEVEPAYRQYLGMP